MRVLIAEDDRDAIMRIGILLRSEGHEVWSIRDALEVGDAVRDFRPQLVLLGTAMPERSGYEIAEELCREYGAACPVLVALADRTSPGERGRAEASGFQHLLAKPFEGEELLALVELCGREALERQE